MQCTCCNKLNLTEVWGKVTQMHEETAEHRSLHRTASYLQLSNPQTFTAVQCIDTVSSLYSMGLLPGLHGICCCLLCKCRLLPSLDAEQDTFAYLAWDLFLPTVHV